MGAQGPEISRAPTMRDSGPGPGVEPRARGPPGRWSPPGGDEFTYPWGGRAGTQRRLRLRPPGPGPRPGHWSRRKLSPGWPSRDRPAGSPGGGGPGLGGYGRILRPAADSQPRHGGPRSATSLKRGTAVVPGSCRCLPGPGTVAPRGWAETARRLSPSSLEDQLTESFRLRLQDRGQLGDSRAGSPAHAPAPAGSFLVAGQAARKWSCPGILLTGPGFPDRSEDILEPFLGLAAESSLARMTWMTSSMLSRRR